MASTSAAGAASHPLLPGASPAMIRSFLLPEDRSTFVAAYEAALDEARRSLDLAPVYEVVEDWRRVALVQADPVRFRRDVHRAAEIVTGEPVPDGEPFGTLALDGRTALGRHRPHRHARRDLRGRPSSARLRDHRS